MKLDYLQTGILIKLHELSLSVSSFMNSTLVHNEIYVNHCKMKTSINKLAYYTRPDSNKLAFKEKVISRKVAIIHNKNTFRKMYEILC